MKKVLLAIGLSFGLLSVTHAQTTNTVPGTLWDFLTTGSNYWAAPYATYSSGDGSFGEGLALGYRASEVVNPILRIDHFGGHFWMPSLTAQLQPPRTLMGKIPVIPFAIAGGAIPIGGNGNGNGQFVSIVGAGVAFKLDSLGSSWFFQHTDIVADYEKWFGLESVKQDKQLRFGVLIKF